MKIKKKSGADLAARFAKLSEVVSTESEIALFEIGVKVKDAAKGIAPVGKTGNYKNSIAVRMRYRGTKPAAVVGTLSPYGTYIEFAKKIDGHDYGIDLAKPARVIYKALDENRNEFEQMIAAAIGRGLGSVEGA